MRDLIRRIDEAMLVEKAANAMSIGATRGMLDFFWFPATHEVEVGLGGEWWNGELERASGVEVVLHHRKEKVDPAYKPVRVKWENERGRLAFTITGGFLSDPATVEIGPTQVVSEGTEAVPMRCNECGKRFRKRIGPKTSEVECPQCHGYDVEPE